jgi:hypothetical protein
VFKLWEKLSAFDSFLIFDHKLQVFGTDFKGELETSASFNI